MKSILLSLIFLLSVNCYGQLTLEDGKLWAKENNIELNEFGSTYIGKADFGAPVIITRDGGLAILGNYAEGETNGVKLVFLNEKKEVMWSHFFGSKNDNLDAQIIIEDRTGFFYVFMEAKDKKTPSDMRERVVKINGLGDVDWDYALERKEDNYHRRCTYVKLHEDGKHLLLFGTVQPDKVAIDNNEHYSWKAKLDGHGKLIQEIGAILKD